MKPPDNASVGVMLTTIPVPARRHHYRDDQAMRIWRQEPLPQIIQLPNEFQLPHNAPELDPEASTPGP